MSKNRNVVCVLAGIIGFCGATRADIVLQTDVPGANSTGANPLEFNIYNNAGVAFPVRVTDITRGMTPAQKAARIREAVMRDAPAFLRGTGGILNNVTLNNSAKKVRLVSDPTKEDFDKLNSDVLASASFGGSGTSTGLDPDGNSSIIRCGIEGMYIAELNAPSSMSASQILTDLASMLTDHGIEAEYSAGQGELTLTDLIGSSENFVFGSSDTGFSMQAQIISVPAPAGACVLGAIGLMQMRRRRAPSC